MRNLFAYIKETYPTATNVGLYPAKDGKGHWIGITDNVGALVGTMPVSKENHEGNIQDWNVTTTEDGTAIATSSAGLNAKALQSASLA